MGWIRDWWHNWIFARAPDLSIGEDEEGLVIKVSLHGKRLSVVLSSLLLPACAAVLLDGFLSRPVVIVATGSIAILGLLLSLRERVVELRVTEREFETVGHFAGSFRRRSSEQRRYTLHLEYRSGFEGVPGLYAKQTFYWACLLPHVNEQQANEIIERIYRRFPDAPAADDASRTNLTILNLD